MKKPGKLFSLSRSRKRSHLRADWSDQYLFLSSREHRALGKGSAMDPAWAHTWKGLNAIDPPTWDVSDTLYEPGEVPTTVYLGFFNSRDSLKMAEPARTDNIIQVEQCLIPCVITSSSTQQKTELQNQDLDLISHRASLGNHCNG